MIDELAEVRVAGGDDGVRALIAAGVAHQVAELCQQRLRRDGERQPCRVPHGRREHVAELVGAGGLDELAREPVERNLGAVEAPNGWLERLDGLRDVGWRRWLGTLNELRDELLPCARVELRELRRNARAS